MNVLGIMLVFWSFRKLLDRLIASSDYKEVLATQSDILRNQTRMIENQTALLKKILEKMQ